jgi:hypothetical protein
VTIQVSPTTDLGHIDDAVGLAIRCTNCGAASVSALFYRGPDAHVCRSCGAPFELADPRHDRRSGADRRADERNADEWAEWRSGEDRRRSLTMEPRHRLRTPSTA